MSREVQVGSLVVDHFPIFKNDGITKHSGLLAGNFLTLVYKDSVPTAIPVTITEIGTSGEYEYSYTPPSIGVYDVQIYSTYGTIWLGEQMVAVAFIASAGSKQITIQIRDGITPLQGVQIDVYDALNLNFVQRVWTPVSGNVAITLDPGTYNLRIFKSGYTFTVPVVLVVTIDATVTYLGTTVIIITPPSSPNLCVIYGTLRNAAGIPVVNAHVRAYSVTPQTVNGVQEGDPVACTVTDSNGYFELELERLAQVNLLIETTGLDVIRTVPNLATQNLVTWV